MVLFEMVFCQRLPKTLPRKRFLRSAWPKIGRSLNFFVYKSCPYRIHKFKIKTSAIKFTHEQNFSQIEQNDKEARILASTDTEKLLEDVIITS